MNNYNEWIIQYHGDLRKVLQGTHTMMDIMNEQYAIIRALDEEVPYIKGLVGIEHMEESRPINEIPSRIDPVKIISKRAERPGLNRKEVIVGWIGHKIIINYQNYNKQNGGTRILCIHDGIRQYNTDQIRALGINEAKYSYAHDLSPMDQLIGNRGIASNSEIVLVNWQKDKFYTADAIRALRFLMGKAAKAEAPMIAYFPFDISNGKRKNNNLVQEIMRDMSLSGKIDLTSSLDYLLNLFLPVPVMEEFRNINIAYEFAPEDAVIDAFIIYNIFNAENVIVAPPNTTLYPLDFPYSGARGPVKEIKELFIETLGKTATASLPFILGNEPLNITQANFKTSSIIKRSIGLKGAGTLIGIIDTGIDYTNPAFIDANGETRIVSIWDQTIGTSSPYGYGTLYDREIIDEGLKSSDPFTVVPHKDEWGHGTILAGIAAGSGKYESGTYEGVAPEAEIVVVKLKPASSVMQDIYYSRYNPLGFSALDIALAFQFMANISNQLQKPISICLPVGTNSGSHDGTNILDAIISSYSTNPGISVVLPVGEEANKGHHATGDLKEEIVQEVILTIPKGQGGFLMEIWAMFGDKLEISLIPPKVEGENLPIILLNEAQTHRLLDTSFVWSQGSKFDIDTGCQVIRFRFGEPLTGDWMIRVKGIVVSEGKYHIWVPKTGMTLPGTVLSPSSPFTTIYNTSTATNVIAVGCYDSESSSTCSSSGRGFTRDNRVSPDFIVEGVNVPGPLPENKWGLITGTSPSSAIAAGLTSLIYENQLIQGEELSNTVVMKAILVGQVAREPTLSYPNPSRGYGLLDINSIFMNKR